MKIITVTALLMFAGAFGFAQTVTVTGTVNNEKGQPVPYAFVRDANHASATYADSTGAFMLKADPASSLAAAAPNYKNTDVKVDNKTSLNIVMPVGERDVAVGGTSDDKTKNVGDESFISNRQLLVSQTAVSGFGTATAVKAGFNQEETRGSRFLFNDWMPGFGISKKDSLVHEITNMYNYDKMNGNLMYTNDKRSTARISNSQIKSFSVYDRKGHAHVFENAPAINDVPFVEVLASTPKYKIYKKIETKLVRADFHTDGVVETGHRYDEYVDFVHYYFVALPDGKPKSISLKKNTLKKMFAGEADSFIASQGSRDVDEDYVRELGNSLSK